MKKISNNDLIRKLDFSQNSKPAYVSNTKTISDVGFRTFMSDVITKDEVRKSEFLKTVTVKS